MDWTPDAEKELKKVPFFVRPAARKKIQQFAQDKGEDVITVQIYEEAKAFFNQ
jgi:hypothetical protein